MSLLNSTSFPHLASVQKRTRAIDSLGGSTDSFTTVYNDLPCWRQQASESQITEYEKRGFVVTDKVYFLADYQLTEEHILLIGSDRLEVVSRARPDASAGKGVVWRVMARITTTGST